MLIPPSLPRHPKKRPLNLLLKCKTVCLRLALPLNLPINIRFFTDCDYVINHEMRVDAPPYLNEVSLGDIFLFDFGIRVRIAAMRVHLTAHEHAATAACEWSDFGPMQALSELLEIATEIDEDIRQARLQSDGFPVTMNHNSPLGSATAV